MAVTATPIFSQALRHSCAAISTANTNRDGSGTLGTVFTAGADGSFIDRIDIAATGTTTAGVIRLFVHNGSTAFLWKELVVGAITPSTSVSVFMANLREKLSLPSGWSLRAGTHNAEMFNIHAFGSDL